MLGLGGEGGASLRGVPVLRGALVQEGGIVQECCAGTQSRRCFTVAPADYAAAVRGRVPEGVAQCRQMLGENATNVSLRCC